ncbi:hypothetical protein WJX74_010987 [Apatococcus lobatus]|uniref:SHSP domain-containing protein n=1 Tax=Apatococcus lobatus TaxID=904363 RepID=A0AAW1RBM3_9CHLO
MSQALLPNPLNFARVGCISSGGKRGVFSHSNCSRSKTRACTVRAGSFTGRPISRSAIANEDVLVNILKDVVKTLSFPGNVQKPTEALQLAVDEYEEGQYYTWCADIPGVEQDQLKVQIDFKDRYLVISGQRELPSDSDYGTDHDLSVRVRRAERESGTFYRKVQLPSDADHDSGSISAQVSDGVLKVTVYKLLPCPKQGELEVDVNF